MNKSVRLLLAIFLWAGVVFFVAACSHRHNADVPKPMGYFRIDLPEHQYQKTDTTLPFTFARSIYSQIIIKPQTDGSCWMDLSYPSLNAAFKFTYFPLENPDSLRNYIVRENNMVKFHYSKADDIEYSIIQDKNEHIWGQIYDIEGKEVATPLQFWITDSSRHFLRATLYFNFTPNNDSLQPIIQYLKKDAMQFINTFAWK